MDTTYVLESVVTPIIGRPYLATSITTGPDIPSAVAVVKRSILTDRSVDSVSVITCIPANR